MALDAGATPVTSPACPSCAKTVRPGARFCGGCGASLSTACPACGVPVEDSSARFCEQCGSPLAVPAAPRSTPPAPSAASPPPLLAPGPTGPSIPGSFGAGRYEVRRFLGEGGRKRVYQAYDRALDREVAVATVKTEDLDADGLERVRREAQAMGRLGDHPHIVTVYDIGEEDARPFIVSQYMSGGSVDDLLAGASDRRLPIADAVRIADEICQALEHAHARGVVHRDIKPANVWLSEDGTTRLGDFGLAAAAASSTRDRLTKEGMMVGTVAYMAPEQALGQDVDARADLYSLGALLYELMVGRPPFVGHDAVTIISQQINTPPMAPWWHNPEVPKDIGALVLELLGKTAEERPATAGEVRRRLSEGLAAANRSDSVAVVSAGEVPPPATPRRTARLNRLSRFVGRAEELRDLKRAVEGALDGRGGVLAVSGEPGIGKTRLTEEAAVYARLGGAQVLVGRSYEAESSLPYMPFVEALRAYVTSRPPDALREELGEGASEVAKLVSEVRNIVPGLQAISRPSGDEERYRLFESVCSFLVNASRAGPIVLILDDLHWADAPSLSLLQHLARRLSDSRLVVIVTYRDMELSRRRPLAECLAELRRDPRFQRIALRGLSLGEVQEFIEGLIERPLEEDEQAVASAFYGETDGNPYFLEEVVRHLLETGGAFWEAGRWQMSMASVESLSIPEGIRELVGQRLSQLSEAGNDVLTRAAVLGAQFDFAVLERMASANEDVLLAALEEALASQVIEQVPSQPGRVLYRFSHAVIRQALYEGLSLPRRQRLHRRAADAIEAVYGQNLAAHLPALALHYRQAGATAEAARAVEYSVKAGEAAQSVFAYEDAARHWEAALELLGGEGDPSMRAALLARLGDVRFLSGVDFERSTPCLERALHLYQQLEIPDRVAQMHSRIGRNLSSFPSSMDIPRALAHYRAAEAILSQAPASSGLGYVSFGQANTALWAVRTEDGLRAAEQALAIAAAVGNDRLRRQAATHHATHLLSAGRLREGYALLEATWQEADITRDVTAAFVASWIGAGHAFDLGDPAAGRAWCERELATSRLSQAPYPRGILLDELGRLEALGGNVAAARRARDEVGASRYAAPRVALCEGRFDEARVLWETLREEEQRTGNRRDTWTSTSRLGMLHRLEGDAEGARELLEAALAIALDGGEKIHEIWTRAELAVLLADIGEVGDARTQLSAAQASAVENEDWRGLVGRLALAGGAVLSAEGAVDDAEASFAAAVEIFRRFSLPWEEAEAERRAGLLRLHTGDRPGAVQRFAGAIEVYRRHGAGRRWIEPLVAEKLAAQGVDSSEVLTSVHVVAAAVEKDRPDLAPHTSPEGTVTLLFSDIEGSTATNERLGDSRWMELLRTHNRIVRQEVARQGGFEVKSQGDGFMVAFSSARRGLASAAAIQRALMAHGAAHPDEIIRVRMGLHTGEAMKEGDDFFGTHVALAARIAASALGGEILVSSLLKELTASSGELVFGPGRDVDLKGFSETRRVYPLLWEDPNGAPTDPIGPDVLPMAPRRLVTLLATDPAVSTDGLLAEVAGEHGRAAPLSESAVLSFASASDAVSVALQLQRQGGSVPGGETPLRIGLHADVLAADRGVGENQLSVAQSLSRRAQPGQVICSYTVAHLLAGRPRFSFASLNGGASEVGAWEVHSNNAGMFPPPVVLVGRETETARLAERLGEAAAGRGGLVLVAGEQGMGKTRVADEVATGAEREGFFVLWGQGHEAEWPPPYAPFVEALESHVRLLEGSELRADLGGAAGAVAQLVPGIRSAVRDTGSTPVPPEEERHRLFDGIGRFLVARARRAPILLVLEDLHWADASTVAMLRHVVRVAGPERILVLGTYRDDELDRTHPLTGALGAWSRDAVYEHLALSSLDGEEVAAFLGSTTGDDIELKVGAAWARETAGNPFFILELLRHLHEEGKLYRGIDGRWTTVAPLRDLALPVAARDVATRRLSRLSEDARRLLTVGAAFEGAFRFEAVSSLAGLSEDAALDALEQAVEARILEPSGDSETYAFTHTVIRHALYDGLVPSRRSRLHRRVAETLEADAGPAPASAAELAVHYHRSIALSGAERGVEPALAAADNAQGTGAYDEAAGFLRMALDMLPASDARRPRLLGRLAIVLAWALAFDDAVAVGEQAGDAIAEAESKQAAAEYLSDAAYTCASAGGIVHSWDLARLGLGYAGARDVAWARLVCFDYQRREAEDPEDPGIPIDSSERREAAAILRAAHLDPIGPSPMEAVFDSRDDAAACSNVMIVTLWAGEHARALPLLETEAREAETLGRLSRAARAWAGVAYAQGALGRLDDARQSFDRAQGLATRLGAPVATLLYPHYLLCGALDEGWEQLAATFGFLRSSSNPALAWVLGFGHVGYAQAAAHLGNVDEAVASLTSVIPWLERAPAWTGGFVAMVCGAAEVLWLLERDDHLETVERTLRDKLLPADFRLGLADARHALARCCALTGRHDEAVRWLAETRLVLTEQAAAPLLAICDFDEALMYARRAGPGDVDVARPLLKAARQQFETIGMTGWTRRAVELEQQLP